MMPGKEPQKQEVFKGIFDVSISVLIILKWTSCRGEIRGQFFEKEMNTPMKVLDTDSEENLSKRKMKMLVPFISVLVGILTLLCCKDSGRFHLNKIAFLATYLAGIYVLFYSRGIYIGKVDIKYTRIVNVIGGTAVLLLSLYCILAPYFR
jgi:hypothetical protein